MSADKLAEVVKPLGNDIQGLMLRAVAMPTSSLFPWPALWERPAFAIAHGTVWSFPPSMISSGPRSGFIVATFASVHGLRLHGPSAQRDPGAGDVNVSESSCASFSSSAFAQQYLNSPNVNVIARPRVSG